MHELTAGSAAAAARGDALGPETAREPGLEAGDVPFDGGGQVGVGAHGRGARDELDHGHQLVAEGDVGEAELARDLADESLVRGEGVGVHQAHGDAADAGVVHALQVGADGVAGRAPQDAHGLAGQAHDEVGGLGGGGAGGGGDAGDVARGVLGVVLEGDALVDLDDGRVEHVGLADGEVEDVRARLVADDEAVAEALGDDEGDGLALALEEGVGGDGGAHADGLDVGRVEGLAAGDVGAREVGENAADGFEGGVGVVGGVFGQELDHEVLAAVVADAVGKGAAAVDGDADAAVLACWGGGGGHDVVVGVAEVVAG